MLLDAAVGEIPAMEYLLMSADAATERLPRLTAGGPPGPANWGPEPHASSWPPEDVSCLVPGGTPGSRSLSGSLVSRHTPCMRM